MEDTEGVAWLICTFILLIGGFFFGIALAHQPPCDCNTTQEPIQWTCIEWEELSCPQGTTETWTSKDRSHTVCERPVTKEDTCTQWNPINGECIAWTEGTNGRYGFGVCAKCIKEQAIREPHPAEGE